MPRQTWADLEREAHEHGVDYATQRDAAAWNAKADAIGGHAQRVTDARTRRERLAAGHGATPTRDERRQLSDAESYAHSPEIEHLIEIRDTDPDRYERVVTPTLRMTVGRYEQAKQAAAALGWDVGER